MRLLFVLEPLTSPNSLFALYRDDQSVDDYTFVESVRRSLFRLHPLGPRRISTGCVVLQYPDEFNRLRALLLKQPIRYLPNTGLRYYGELNVVVPGPEKSVRHARSAMA